MSSRVANFALGISKDNDSGIEDAEIEKPPKGVPTDTNFYGFHAVVLCGLGALIAYCAYNGDINRILAGYDNYGNICGIDNIVQDDIKLSDTEGQNMKMRPYLLVFKPEKRNNYIYNVTYTGVWALDIGAPQNLSKEIARICVPHCRTYPYYVRFKKRCILKKMKGVWDRISGKIGHPDILREVAEDLLLCWKQCFYIGLGSSVLSFTIMLLFCILTKVMVWLIIIAAVIVASAFTIYMWFLFAQSKQTIDEPNYLASEIELERNRTYLIFALIGTCITLYLIYFIITNKKKLGILIQLYKEIIKSIKAMPLLLLQPVVTCLFVSAIISASIYAMLWIESSGDRKRFGVDYLIFKKNPWNILARWYNIFACIWMIHFVLNCQYMIVARAVSLWYFRINKDNLGMPISYGFYNLVLYHLGSVSLGSLLTILVEIPRMILKIVQIFLKVKEENIGTNCCSSYIRLRDNSLKYFTRDAYVEIVIYGYPFRTAGRQAFKALTANDLDITAVKVVAYYVLYFAYLLVCAASMLTGAIILQKEEDLLHMWAILILIGIFVYLISTCFFSLYESMIDTIFLCFCEDYNHHQGITKPCYISKPFLEIVKNLENIQTEKRNHQILNLNNYSH